MTSTLEWPRRLAIVGTGLLGASVGLAARAAGVAEVVGADNDRRELRDALELEAITSRARSVEEAAEGADLIVAATPVRSLAGVLARALAVNPEAVLTDVGSTKLHLLVELQRSSANLRRVIPGHPMAGSEERGARAARVDLFHGAAWVLTPAPHVDHQALRRLTSFVRDLGGRPLMLDPELHDQVAAFASHLPQLAATALMGAVAQVESPAALRRLVASGFRDTTRVAASDPDLWVDICATNGPSIVAALDVLTSRLEVLRKLIAEGDRVGLREELATARAARLRIPTKPGVLPTGPAGGGGPHRGPPGQPGRGVPRPRRGRGQRGGPGHRPRAARGERRPAHLGRGPGRLHHRHRRPGAGRLARPRGHRRPLSTVDGR